MTIKKYYYYYYGAMPDFEFRHLETPAPVVSHYVNVPVWIHDYGTAGYPSIVDSGSDEKRNKEVENELLFDDETNLDLCDFFFNVAIRNSALKDVIGLGGYAEVRHLIDDLMILMSESNLEEESARERLSYLFLFLEEDTLFERFKELKIHFCARVAADSKSPEKDVRDFVARYHEAMINNDDQVYKNALGG